MRDEVFKQSLIKITKINCKLIVYTRTCGGCFLSSNWNSAAHSPVEARVNSTILIEIMRTSRRDIIARRVGSKSKALVARLPLASASGKYLSLQSKEAGRTEDYIGES